MNKITKLRICDWSLLLLTASILISGIQLEATDSGSSKSVWIHIVLGLLFVALVTYHIYLHFGRSNWFERFYKQKNQYTRVLWWVSLAMFATGIVAIIHWLATFSHSTIGGIHGKIGFIMILLSAGHICKRIKFFHKKKTRII